MKKALLAIKQNKYSTSVSALLVGAAFRYDTTRESIVNKLVAGDEVWLRVQGDGDVKAIFTVVNATGGSHINLILKRHCAYSTKHIFNIYEVKAGAECGWLK